MGFFHDDDPAGDGAEDQGAPVPRKLKRNAALSYQQDAAGLWVYLLDSKGPIFLGRVGYDRNNDLERLKRIIGKPQPLAG